MPPRPRKKSSGRPGGRGSRGWGGHPARQGGRGSRRAAAAQRKLGRTTVAPRPPEAASRADLPADWLEEFEAAARRPLATRMRYAFIHTYKPVLDDAPYCAFDTMADYRRWCEENLPDWLGYGRV